MHGDEKMNRMYIALALAGVVGVAALINAGVIAVDIEDPLLTDTYEETSVENETANESCAPHDGYTGEYARQFHKGHMMKNEPMMQNGYMMQNKDMNQFDNHNMLNQRDMHQTQNNWYYEDYLNITRLEGILSYDNGSYMIDTTVLYLGNEYLLQSLAKSDFDGDGVYENVWQEFEGLVGTELVVNGIIDGNTLYVSHINGIWLTMPKQNDIVELEGIMESINGSFFVNGTELFITKNGRSLSDIDGDGKLEPMIEEINGLVGENVSVDGTTIEGGLLVIHINGIWAK